MSADSHEKHSPLDQFRLEKIHDDLHIEIGGIDISFTNSSLYMVLATAIAIIFMLYATRKRATTPDRLQVVAESVYNFVFNMVESSIGKEGVKFFPLIFCLFTFILICNVLGLTPYSFTVTSHVTVTFILAIIAFSTVTIFAIVRNGFLGFIGMFLPAGVPWWMAPFIFLIELFSFLIRPITLAVRLFANMVAGHVLLKVVATFIVSLGIIFGIAPLLFAVIMTGFELFIGVLQAYIFAILVCAYLGEVTRQH